MEIRFYCENPDCEESAKGESTLKIRQEIWMDENNCATLFCQRCHQSLVPHPADLAKEQSTS